MAAGLAPSPFVGRSAELAALRTAWRDGGRVVLVSGPAGIGKSRILRELGAHATSLGATVLVGRSTAAAPAMPLRPITEALLGAARRGVRPGPELRAYTPILARLVPDWSIGAAPPTDALPTLQLGEAILRLLSRSAADGPPALLVVEDVHWADPESLDVLEYLADNVADHPVLVVASVRSGEPGPGVEAVGALVRRGVADEVRLTPLEPAVVADLARARLGGDDLPTGMTDELWERTEGVPLFVEELLAAAATSGWGSVGASVPGSVQSSVALRLGDADDRLRRLVLVAALLGRHFDWRVTAAACGIDHDAAAALLREAVRMQLLDVADAGFRFHHALTADAVVAMAAPADIEVAAAAALGAIVDAGELDGERCLVATGLALRCGQPDAAVDLLVRAGRAALDQGSPSSADRFVTQARELADPGRHDRDEIDELLLEICVLVGDAERGTRIAAELLRSPAPAERLADRHLLAAALELAAGRWDAALDHTDAAMAATPVDGDRRARAEALAAHAAMGQDAVAAALDRANRALAAAGAAGQVGVRCEALEVVGRIERGRDLAAAEAAFRRAHDAAAEAGLDVWRVRALQELGTIDLFDSLRLDRLHAARAEALRIGAHAVAAMVDLQLAATHLERGEVADALEVARRCAETSRRFGLSTEPMGVVVQAMAHARRGDRSAMDEALAAGTALARDVDYVEASVWGNAVPILRLVEGDLRAAAEALDRGMEVVRRRPAAALPYPGLWALLRTLLDDGGDEARAEVDLLEFDTPVSRRALRAAHAVAAGRSGAGDPDDEFAAADELPASGIEPFRRPLVRLLVAPAAHAGRWGEPDRWLREALASFERNELETLAGRCRRTLRELGLAVPRRSAIAPEPVPPGLAGLGVTGREVEVLALVAGGATNREVAERLVISPRTVDKHVERLLQKTGTTRGGLREVAARAGLLDT